MIHENFVIRFLLLHFWNSLCHFDLVFMLYFLHLTVVYSAVFVRNLVSVQLFDA